MGYSGLFIRGYAPAPLHIYFPLEISLQKVFYKYIILFYKESTFLKKESKMSTCSLIGFKPATTLGTAPIQYIYCHFDGYPTGVGAVLNEHYTTPEKVKQLMELGNLSILAPEIGFKRNFDAPYGDEKAMAIHRENNKKYCLAYGRDRGEDNQGASLILKASAFFSEVDANGCDFGYLFDESTGEWDFCDYHGNSKNLKQYLTEKQGEAA